MAFKTTVVAFMDAGCPVGLINDRHTCASHVLLMCLYPQDKSGAADAASTHAGGLTIQAVYVLEGCAFYVSWHSCPAHC